MNEKKWYLSKSVWTGIVSVVLAAYSTASVQFHLPAVPEFVFGILGAFGVYSRVSATSVIK